MCDDYAQSPSSLFSFLHIINYQLSHKKNTLILCIQGFTKNNLYSFIFQNSFLFLTYCKLNMKTIRHVDTQNGTDFKPIFETSFDEGDINYHICFINLDRNYIIPFSDKLFSCSTDPCHIKMFKQDKTFYILDSHTVTLVEQKDTSESSDLSDDDDKQSDIESNLFEMLNTLCKHNNSKIILFARQLFTVLKPYMDKQFQIRIKDQHFGNFLDFVKLSQNPKLDTTVSQSTLNLLKWLRNKNVKFAKLFFKNKVFTHYLCSGNDCK